MSEPPYSRTRRAGPLLVTAGILGRSGEDLADGVEAQVVVAFDNLAALLSAEGLAESDVVRLVVYLTDIADMEVLNRVFCERFSEPRPTRSTVAVNALPAGARVEIEATASLG